MAAYVEMRSVLPAVTKKTVAYLNAVIKREAFTIERDMKQSMQGGGNGRIYYRRGKAHQASSPGDPPAVDTGHLRRSIHTEASDTVLTGIARVHIDAEYAAYLEYGTRKMQPRPYVKPAVEKSRVRLMAIKVPSAVFGIGGGVSAGIEE